MTFPSENHPPRQHERNAMTDIVNRLRTNRECLAPCLMDEAADEIVRLERVTLDLIAERDEARRALCRVESACRTLTMEEYIRGNADFLAKWVAVDPKEIARERGWYCFKEDGK
jgi:hypothetical protein